MSKRLKFIHTADIHLGSILHLGRKADKALSDIFNNAVYNSFEKLCDFAINQQVDFILISGDIYDREARSVKANSFFLEQCRRLEAHEIMVYALGGNHDPVKKNSELFTLPANVHIFSSEKAEAVEYKNKQGEDMAAVIGQSYKENWDSRKMHKNYNTVKKDILNIALLHTQLDGSNNYVPCTASDLKAVENIHYWALGHIHKFSIINEKEPTIVYPGIPQGRDFGEEGSGGAVIVEAEGSKITSMSYVPLSQVLWKKISLQLDKIDGQEPKNISDLEEILISKAEEILNRSLDMPEGINVFSEGMKSTLNGYAVRWLVSGGSELYKLFNDKDEEIYEYILESLNSKLLNREKFLYTDSIEFNLVRSSAELEALKSEHSSLKAVSDFSRKSIENEELKQQLIKRLGSLWEVTDNLEDINFKKLQLDDELLLSIIQQAEQLAIDALLQRSEEN